MEGRIVTILLVLGLCAVSSDRPHRYHHVNKTKTWTEAQSYCREKYTDLATIDNMDVMNKLIQKVGGVSAEDVWIGLYDDFRSWRWSLSDQSYYGPGESGFRKWYPNHPKNSDQYCVVMFVNRLWAQWWCDTQLPFVCSMGKNYYSYYYYY
ncbi:lithostathine-like [Aplochiton taeniatus]